MSFMDIFKQAPIVTPTVQPVAPTPGVVTPNPVIPASPIPGNIPAPTVSAEPGTGQQAPALPVPAPTPAEPAEPKSPLDEFTNLWDTKPVDPNAPAPVEAPELNAESVQTAVAKADFSSAITPETLAAISAGGDDAQTAFATAMNVVAQKVMTQAIMVNDKLTKQAIAKASKAYEDSLPEMLRASAAADHLKTSNPLFSNPAVKPVIEATQAQLLQKFPNATHAEITKMTQDYIIAMGESFTPKAVVNDNSGGETDWEKYLEVL